MKNKKENKKASFTLIKEAIALFMITLVSGLALSFVYETTKEPIAQQAVIKLEKANKAVFTEADGFTADEALMGKAANTDLASINPDYKGVTINNINKALDQNKEAIGYNITVTTTTGYKDPITLVIGYSKEGVVKGVEITSINETAGLGMIAKEPEFLAQYLSKNVEQFVVTKTGAASEDQIDAISGATITTKAVTNAINAAIGFIKEFGTEFGGGKDE